MGDVAWYFSERAEERSSLLLGLGTRNIHIIKHSWRGGHNLTSNLNLGGGCTTLGTAHRRSDVGSSASPRGSCSRGEVIADSPVVALMAWCADNNRDHGVTPRFCIASVDWRLRVCLHHVPHLFSVEVGESSRDACGTSRGTHHTAIASSTVHIVVVDYVSTGVDR